MTLNTKRLLATLLLSAAAAQPVFAERPNEHPAVEVARAWSTRPIDANTFIVAHPARLTLVSAPTQAALADRRNEHPAVRIARTWSSKPIDANTFIVAHPARLNLVSASPAASRSTDEVVLATHASIMQ